MSVAATTATSRAGIATAVRESAQGAVDKVSTESASAQTMMHKKKQQRLLEKVETGRPWTKVMKSAPVGTAALTSAPKLSDFKVGTRDERVREHAAAMQRWGQNNLTTKAIEYATRVRKLRGGSNDRGFFPPRYTDRARLIPWCACASSTRVCGGGLTHARWGWYAAQKKYWACTAIFGE